MIDLGMSKKDKKEHQKELECLKKKFDLLRDGNLNVLQEEFSGLYDLISNLLTHEERLVLQSRKETSKHKNHARKSLDEILQIQDEVNTFRQSLVDSVELAGKNNTEVGVFLDKIQSISIDVTCKANEVTEKKTLIDTSMVELTTLLSGVDNLKARISAFEELALESEESFNKVGLIQTKVTKLHSDIKTLHNEINGYNEEQEGEVVHIAGLKEELEVSYKSIKSKLCTFDEELDEFKIEKIKAYDAIEEKWNAKFDEVGKKIKSLLPGAMTAGLSYAYKEKKDNEIIERKGAQKTFYIAVLGLTLISLIPFAFYNYMFFTLGKSAIELLESVPRVMMSILPLYIPAFWVAYSANKKSSLSKRLIEEYSHKEALSKTFEGLSTQIGLIDDEDASKDLATRLLYNLVDVSSENPGKLISDYNKSDHPIYDALDKSTLFTKSLDRISGIPGMETILTKINENKKNTLIARSYEASRSLTNESLGDEGATKNH